MDRKDEAPGYLLRNFWHPFDHGAVAAVQHAVLRDRIGRGSRHVRVLRAGTFGGARVANDAKVQADYNQQVGTSGLSSVIGFKRSYRVSCSATAAIIWEGLAVQIHQAANVVVTSDALE